MLSPSAKAACDIFWKAAAVAAVKKCPGVTGHNAESSNPTNLRLIMLNQQLLHHAVIDITQCLEIGNANTFIYLMDSRIDWTQFNDLSACWRDKTTI